MSIDAMKWVWTHRHPQQTPVDRLVLLALADAGNDDGVGWTGIDGLMTKADASRSAVYESLKRLAATGQLRSWKEGRRTFHQVLMAPPSVQNPDVQNLESVQDPESSSPESGNPPAPPYKENPKKSNPKREARRSAVEAVYTAWKDGTGRNGTTKLTDDRRAKINARLEDGYTVEQLIAVVTRGWKADPWPERVNQNDLTILLRSGSQVEKFLELAAEGRRTPGQADHDARVERTLRENALGPPGPGASAEEWAAYTARFEAAS